MAERPLGITIICVLGFIGAIIGILIGAATFSISSLLVAYLGLFSAFVSVFAGILIVWGLVIFVGSFWMWKMLKKGWILVMIMYGISVILGLISFQYVSLVIPILFMIYLYMKKDLFQ